MEFKVDAGGGRRRRVPKQGGFGLEQLRVECLWGSQHLAEIFVDGGVVIDQQDAMIGELLLA